MKEIKLTQGKTALVDDEDFNYLNQWKWCVSKVYGYDRFYARRSIWDSITKKTKWCGMHRIIINAPKNMLVDHIDHNGLNNQKCNLRLCNHYENMRNNIRHKSGYKGIALLRGKYILSQITFNHKHINLGYFKTKEDAARAYDKKAKELFGEFANLNFK